MSFFFCDECQNIEDSDEVGVNETYSGQTFCDSSFFNMREDEYEMFDDPPWVLEPPNEHPIFDRGPF